MTRTVSSRIGTALWLLALLGCEPSSTPQTTDSQTNWLRECKIDAQCGGLSCLCGVCTSPCRADAACANLEGSECIATQESGAIAVCGGTRSTRAGLCLPRCNDGICPTGQMCVAAVCVPVPEPDAQVSVNAAEQHQALIGFGATMAFVEGQLASHPRRQALEQAAFAELGLDVLRLRNRYGQADENLDATRDLIDSATASLGRTPTIVLTSWTPPPGLKASGAAYCSGNLDTCTLARNLAGSFDYAGLATHFRNSLEAYARVGVTPDFFGLQNNPNWVPGGGESGEACRFLPVQGTDNVLVNGSLTTVQYPGYAEALTATRAALAGLGNVPKILVPETSDIDSVASYVSELDLSSFDAVGYHLYGESPSNPKVASFTAVGQLGANNGKPVLQTEMESDGLGTAVLIHHVVASEAGAGYMTSRLIGSVSGPNANAQAPIGLSTSDFTLQAPYYALQHYALHTDPGWVRVGSTSTVNELLATAWLAPDGDALTVVLVNTSSGSLSVKVDVGEAPTTSSVTRTVFDGAERGAALGSLSSARVVSVPPRSMVTLAFGD